MQRVQTIWDSPVGPLRIAADVDLKQNGVLDHGPVSELGHPAIKPKSYETVQGHCVGVYFPEHHPAPQHWDETVDLVSAGEIRILDTIVVQLAEYFGGQRDRFEIPCQMFGTPFQQEVWAQLSTIPAGQTVTYREIAIQIARPQAIRAVGAAVARNPISIIVPCHRVIGSNGKLTGFAGGVERKEWMLNLEKSTHRAAM
ncbi:methylated-DNA--[protein]-cysteine S-methyltransferase [Neorhodopirellula lusitana]|uniref:methylated-DNA--[protein]-cysteine S-methyltransferase n=1 Tax=Neorhodopirellula lusitana TaxID=445327 RepID=UPI00384F2D32